MEFTQQDREELYNIWMSKKAKMRLIQMEIVKKLGMTQHEFSALLRGDAPLTLHFIDQFCQLMHVDPRIAIPSLSPESTMTMNDTAVLKMRVAVEGEVQRAYVEGNQVIIEYRYPANSL